MITAPNSFPVIHPAYARLLCMVLRRLEVDVDQVLQGIRLSWDDLNARERPLDLYQVQHLMLSALQHSERPWLGLELGLALPNTAHGPLGYAVTSARDVRQALEVLCKYGGLRHQILGYEMTPTADGARLRVVEFVDFGGLRRFLLDVLFAAILNLLHSLGVDDVSSITVDCPMITAGTVQRYANLFPCQLRFPARDLVFHIGSNLLNAPNATADAKDHEAACR